MAIKLGQLLRAEQRTFRLDVGLTEPVKVTYYPTKLTLETITDLQAALTAREMDKVAAILAEIISHWDIVDDDAGEMVPITTESLRRLPMQFIGSLVRGIGADVNPQGRSEEPSNGGSFSAGKRARRGARNGTSSSEPPATSA